MLMATAITNSTYIYEYGISSPYIGFLFILGLLFGPYGALGAVLGNIVLDLYTGFTPLEIIPSAIISFGVSYLAYKLWYSGFKSDKVRKPRLDTIYQLSLFLSIMMICGLIFSAAHAIFMGIIVNPLLDEYVFISYFLNFINAPAREWTFLPSLISNSMRFMGLILLALQKGLIRICSFL